MLRVLSREGAALQVSGFFLNAVVQAELLFGLDTWLVTPPHGQGPGGGSGSGGKTTYRTAPAEDTKREVEIHLSGDGTVGSGGRGGGGIHQAFPEHGRTVHCYAITVRPV